MDSLCDAGMTVSASPTGTLEQKHLRLPVRRVPHWAEQTGAIYHRHTLSLAGATPKEHDLSSKAEADLEWGSGRR